MKMVFFRILAVVTAALVPTASLACVAGTYYDKPVGDFKAEMSYNAYHIKPGQTVRFHFDLVNVSSRSYGPGTPIDYDSVEATFLRDGKTVLTTSIPRVDYGETAFDAVMPTANTNEVVAIRYLKKGAVLSSVSFPIRIGLGNIWRTILTLGSADASLIDGVTVVRQ